MEFNITHYGELRDVNANNEEVQIFNILLDMSEHLEIVRVSDNYLTARLGEWDVARFKFTQRAKWIYFPIFEKQSERHKIETPEDVRNYAELVENSAAHINKY